MAGSRRTRRPGRRRSANWWRRPLAVDTLDYIAPLELYTTLHYVFEAPMPESQQPTPLNEIADCRWFSVEDLGKRSINKAIRRLLKTRQRPGA